MEWLLGRGANVTGGREGDIWGKIGREEWGGGMMVYMRWRRRGGVLGGWITKDG